MNVHNLNDAIMHHDERVINDILAAGVRPNEDSVYLLRDLYYPDYNDYPTSLLNLLLAHGAPVTTDNFFDMLDPLASREKSFAEGASTMLKKRPSLAHSVYMGMSPLTAIVWSYSNSYSGGVSDEVKNLMEDLIAKGAPTTTALREAIRILDDEAREEMTEILMKVRTPTHSPTRKRPASPSISRRSSSSQRSPTASISSTASSRRRQRSPTASISSTASSRDALKRAAQRELAHRSTRH